MGDGCEHMKCIEIFSGAGGMAEGLRQAGWKHSLLVDKCKKACSTLERNGFENVVCASVDTVDYSPFKGVDMLCGGPPCQPFSIGGKDGGEEDDRNGWEEAIRAVRETRCKCFLFENVQGMLRKKFAPYREDLIKRFEEMGYSTQVFSVNAAHYGCPQNRRRALLIGFLDPCAAGCFSPPPKREGAPLTVREAIQSLGKPSASREDGHVLHGNAKSYKGHTGSTLDSPSKTIVAGRNGPGGGANTIECGEGVRYYTIREAARIQTFPDDYVFPSTWSHAYHLIGNAVPPLLAKEWGKKVMKALHV